MSEADHIWDELDAIYRRWGISQIPFSESANTLDFDQIREVFTGRETELREVLGLFRGRERKRLYVYGWIGIGKTAFILQILDVLQRKAPNTLATYISLPPETDLATAALIALARQMPDDEWAQHQLNQMGLRPTDSLKNRKSNVKGSVPTLLEGSFEETPVPVNRPSFPTLSFEDLLRRARQKYDRVVIAIDDLDKQDPSQARQLLHDAQGMLKGGAWFILTGHPAGLTRDLLTTERGLFDLCLELKALDQETTYHMLVKYLNSARNPKQTRNPKQRRTEPSDLLAVKPFTLDAAHLLCRQSGGVPRFLNRLGNYVLLRAAELGAEQIDVEVLRQGLEFADQQLRGQPGLTPEDLYVLNLTLEKGMLSDENLDLKDLDRLKVKEFNEILPILENLIQKDLIRRLPTERAAIYMPTPMITEVSEEDHPKATN